MLAEVGVDLEIAELVCTDDINIVFPAADVNRSLNSTRFVEKTGIEDASRTSRFCVAVIDETPANESLLPSILDTIVQPVSVCDCQRSHAA